MNTLMQWFGNFQGPYMPHGSCYLWQKPLVFLHVISDSLIAIAYFSIPIMLVYFVRKRQDTPFTPVFLLFGGFIAFCGIGHLFDIWTLWFPNYWIAGTERAMTAFISCLTAVRLFELTPQFLALRSPQELERLNQKLEREIAARRRSQQTLQNLVKGTAAATGSAFFPALVKNLAQALQVRQAFVSEYAAPLAACSDASGAEPSESNAVPSYSFETMRSLAVWADGSIQQNFEAPLQAIPCSCVVQAAEPQYYPDLLQDRFPGVELLAEWDAEAYLGVPLLNEAGESIGSLCITHDRPLDQAEDAQAIMTVFAARATAELQRQRAEADLRRTYAELEQRVADRTAELSQANTRLTKVAQWQQATTQVIQHMRQSLDLESIFRATTQELRRAMDCDRVLVYRFNPDWSGNIIAEAVAGQWRPLLLPASGSQLWQANSIQDERCTVRLLSIQDNVVRDTYMQDNQGGVYAQGVEHLAVDNIYTQGFSDCYLEMLESLQAHAYLTVPIHTGKRLWGLLACYQNSGPRPWEIDESKMVSRIGAQLGVAIQQAELFQYTQRQAEELKAANAATERASQAKSEFLANMSHELRTPLNSILGFTQLMASYGDLAEQNRDYVGIINTSGEHLLGLINNILEMSKIEAGKVKLDLAVCDLHRLLGELQSLLTLKAQEKELILDITWAPDVPPYIYGDPQKLRQVLLNLLGNSIKFTQTGEVTLRVETATLPAAGVQIPLLANKAARQIALTFTIQDTGAGIAEAELSQLFEAFQQTQSGRDVGQGTGLGLPISQQYVQLMGGELTVTSTVGRGSEFSFTLSTQALDEAAAADDTSMGTAIGLAPGQTAPRVLIVEDCAANRRLLRQLLEPLGIEIREAVNGEVALTVWRTWAPQLIWMDMRMPEMDGYEATRQIRAEEAAANHPQTLIIALTASAFEENKQAMIAAGCNDILSKPFQAQDLLQKMQQYLGLEFIYERDADAAPSSGLPLTADALADLPAEWIEKLHRAALECDDHKILQLLDDLPPDRTVLNQGLRLLLDQFLFDDILALTGLKVGLESNA